jgi:transcriptional regulator with XRE-family HTH domain
MLDKVSPPKASDPPWRSRHAHRSCDPRAASLLRTYRQARGWTVTEAAQHTGVSRRMIGMLEAGQRRPSESVADTLIGAYRITGSHARDVRAIALANVGRDSPYRTGVTPGPWLPTTARIRRKC